MRSRKTFDFLVAARAVQPGLVLVSSAYLCPIISMNAAQIRARTFFLECRLRRTTLTATNIRCAERKPTLVRHFANHPRRNDAVPSSPSGTVSDVNANRFRPYYITTPIFYVNAEPHVGHLYTILLADVLKRWQVLKGDHQAALLTGTDEHGMKVQKAAEKLDLPTKELCDKNAEVFKKLAETANVSYDRFMRTTDPDHRVAVEHFWSELKKRDFIYQSTHKGWYSVSDETFYPESQIHLVLDPPTGRKHFASIETGKEVEWTEETNYHFRLSAFRDRLLEHYEQHPDFIVPVQRMNFIKKEVEAGLTDLSVSRPSSRLQWGIRVPDDDTQTIYVWLDALINYITMTGYPSGQSDRHKLWPPNVQVIGKDIVRFHCIYWPAFLMALDIPLPRAFLTHAHWTLGTAKMSKSSGNGVNPFYAIDRYGLDIVRYFMLHDGGIVDDSAYDNSYLVDRYKKGLQNGLGNFLARILRSKRFDIGVSVEKMAPQSNFKSTQIVNDMISRIDETAAAANQAMDQVNPRQALHVIMQLVYDASKFFQDAAPWDLSKKPTPENTELLHQIIYTSAETARVVCILLQPFMPTKMNQALEELNVDPSKRTFEYAHYGRDDSYGKGAAAQAQALRPNNHNGINKARYDTTLFPPLVTEF